MDIYSFINSRDVAKYCREINKTWSPFEMAVIINRSQCPIIEKHKAWRELMNDYPDMPMPKNHEIYGSFHEKLKEYIDFEERILACFKKPETNAVYIYEVFRNWHNDYTRSDSVYTDFEKVINDIHNSWELDEVIKIKVGKIYTDNNGSIQICMDYDGNIYWVSSCSPEFVMSDEMINFDLYYADIPVPFKRGDILTANSLVFVLNRLMCDDQRLYQKFIKGELGDGTNMIGWGFYVDDDGILSGNHEANYDCFEYYREKLEGKDRLLHYVSLYLQGEKNEINLPALLAMQCRIMVEHQLENRK